MRNMTVKSFMSALCAFGLISVIFALAVFPSPAHALAFRITRPIPLPPRFNEQSFSYARVGYGAGVFAVFGDFSYDSSFSLVYSQVYLTMVSPQGQVLDSLPILVTQKMDGGWYNQNTCWTMDAPPYDGTNFLLTFGHDSLPPNPIYVSRIGPSGPLLDSVGVAPADYGDQINNGCAFGDSTYLISWVGRRPPSMKRWTCAARIRKDRSSPDSIGFIVDLRDTSITPLDNMSSLAYNGRVFLVVWNEFPGSVWAARVTEAGVVLDTVPILVKRDLATDPMVASDGQDFFILFFLRDTIQNCRFVAGARVGGSGSVLDTIPIRISRFCSDFLPNPIGLTFNGWDYQAVWTTSETGEEYVYGARITPGGVVKDTAQPRLFPTSPRSQKRPSAATATGGRVLVAWANEFDGHIYGAFLDTTGMEVGVEELRSEVGEVRVAVSLGPPVPNPMRNNCEISFQLPHSEKAHLAVYDALGRKVKVILEEEVRAGSHRVRWDASDNQGHPLPSGVYFLRLEAGSVSLTRKLVILR